MAVYTDKSLVKQELRIAGTSDDTMLDRFVEAASRTWDRITARSREAADYYTLANVTDELLSNAIVNKDGTVVVWPHKAKVNSVTAFAWRSNPLMPWRDVDVSKVIVPQAIRVEAWAGVSAGIRGKVYAKISYSGGLAAAYTGLPADLVEAVTLLAGRFYKEGETGLSDIMGIAEYQTFTYTKAIPVRVKDVAAGYLRTVPW